jgi:ATP/ADP translocase
MSHDVFFCCCSLHCCSLRLFASAPCAAGGGAFVIPYLTVYAVLPVSVLFLFLFSAASHRMSRAALFNTILVGFMAFFGGFALLLYPNADVLHPHALADQMQQVCCGCWGVGGDT